MRNLNLLFFMGYHLVLQNKTAFWRVYQPHSDKLNIYWVLNF